MSWFHVSLSPNVSWLAFCYLFSPRSFVCLFEVRYLFKAEMNGVSYVQGGGFHNHFIDPFPLLLQLEGKDHHTSQLLDALVRLVLLLLALLLLLTLLSLVAMGLGGLSLGLGRLVLATTGLTRLLLGVLLVA